MNNQIIIRVLGLGWDDWHHPWYAAGHEFTGEESAENIHKLIKRDNKRKISAKLTVAIPTRKKLTVLGTMSFFLVGISTSGLTDIFLFLYLFINFLIFSAN